MFWVLNWLIYKFSLHNKVVKPESGEKYAQIKHSLQAKTVLNKCVKH